MGKGLTSCLYGHPVSFALPDLRRISQSIMDLKEALIKSGVVSAEPVTETSSPPRFNSTDTQTTAKTRAAEVLELACDASVMFDARGSAVIAAWAYYAIGFSSGIRGGVIESPVSNTDVELEAAVHGLDWVSARARPEQTISVLTDCAFTESWIQELNERKAGLTKRVGLAVNRDRLHALLRRLETIINTHTVTCRRVNSQVDNRHRSCHNFCKILLDSAILRNPALYDAIHGKVPATALARAVIERQAMLDRAAELTHWIARHQTRPKLMIQADAARKERFPVTTRTEFPK